MKKLILGFVLSIAAALSVKAQLVPSTYLFQLQLNTTADDFLQYWVPLPTVTSDGIWVHDGTANRTYLANLGTGLSYNSGTRTLSVSGSGGSVTSVGFTSSDFDVVGSPITSSGTITAHLKNTGVVAGTYSGLTVTDKGLVTAGSVRAASYPSRALNTIYQPSSTRDTLVNYSVDVSTSATLLGGQTGTVFLEISPSSTFASGVQEVGRFVNGNSVSLAIAITVTQSVTGTLSGYVPSGFYVRLRTANTTGTPTFNYRSGQEVQL
jgi:hypothetical protein